jgi:proteasome lid subunit RPN8/RPN11/LysM repeat protein
MTSLLSPELLRMVEDHVASDVEREVGGVLVGEIEDDVAMVSAVIPALAAVGSTANVTFTQEVWEDVHTRIDRDYPGCQIVGWYHSHPGFGIFLSAYDLFIHENFFPSAGHVALVVDPLAGEAGWFGWREGSVVEIERFAARAVAGKTRQAEAQAAHHAGQRPWRTAALLGLPVVALAGFVAGQLLTPGTDPVSDDRTVATEAEDGATNDVLEGVEQLMELDNELNAAHTRVRELENELEALEAGRRAETSVPSTRPEEQNQHLAYTIGAGDTLWGIAKRVYGSGDAWARIAEANPDVEPTALAQGSQLRIPISPEQLVDQEATDDSDDDSS